MGKLLEIAEKDSNVIEILADSGSNLDELFRRNFPGRLLNFGIAEQNAIGVSAGMAMSGFVPFVFLQGAFIAYRAMEFIRDDLCFHNANVKLIGQGSGLALSGLGPSHHTTEDIGVLRNLPGLCIISPATPIQVRECTEYIYGINGPCYMRIGMNGEHEYFDDDYSLPSCGFDIFGSGKKILIISTGSILEEVVPASDILNNHGIETTVINLFQIKPFNSSALLNKIEELSPEYIVTVEEHQVGSGIGNMLSDAIERAGKTYSIISIGFDDTFAKGYNETQHNVRVENEIDAEGIARRVENGYSKGI